MELTVFTTSDSFRHYFSGIPELNVSFQSQWQNPVDSQAVYLVHRSSMQEGLNEWLQNFGSNKNILVGVCSDNPEIGDMLEMVKYGAKAYCNSYMRTIHFQQLIRMLGNGQSWFSPELMAQTFELAHKAVHGNDMETLLEPLTAREIDIAKAVLEGMSNKQIASKVSISEPTVKTHLTNIFKKLQIKDRVELVLYLKQG